MSAKNKVLLLFPSQFYFEGRDIILTSRLYLASLEAFIHKEANVDILDLETKLGRPLNEEDVEKFMTSTEKIFSQMPDYDVVGVSCYTSYSYLSTISVGTLVRKYWPNATIVVGGYHPTAVPDDFTYEGAPFDFVVRGEGERALQSIVTGDLKRHEHPQILAGDQLRPEEWPKVVYEKYDDKNSPFMIALSRGCNMKCNFCCQSGETFSSWRSSTPSDALDYVKQIYNSYAPSSIVFADPNFGYKREWMCRFLEGLVALNLPLGYWAECRAEHLDDRVMSLISKLKFRFYFGVDSLSCRTLKVMGKTHNPKLYIENVLAVLHKIISNGIHCTLGFVANHPGEDVQSFRETLSNIWQLIKDYDQISCVLKMVPFVLYPGTHIFENRKHYESMYGYRVEAPYWWRDKTQDIGILCSRSIGSSSLFRLYGFTPNFWTKEWSDLKKEAIKRLPPSL
jgi:radical SAM superfamily enzyme YgiQ (UPF0313 family)